MKNLKKVLSLVLALSMALSLMTVAFAADAKDFADYNEVENTEAVDVMVALGVFNGKDGNKFAPNDTLTREEAAKIVTYMLLGQEDADKLTADIAPYADVAAGRWSAGAIAYCTNEGILTGSNGKFYPTGKLTGQAFAKMLLCALGYDAKIENLEGSAWAINASKLAVTAGLTEKLGALSGVMTREQAAQMAFNAMTARMVDYTGGTNVTTPDGTTIVVDADRYYVGNSTTTGYRMEDSANDEYLQFCEQYASKLKLNKGGSDDLDRPSNEWIYENKSVGTYAKTPAVVYTSYMNNDDGKKTVKNNLKNYYYGTTTNAGLSSSGNADTVDNIDTYGEVAALTGNGRSVEIYVTDNVITDIVAIDSELIEVKKVTKDEVTFVSNEANAVADDDDLYGFFSKLEKGDKVVAVLDNKDIVEAYEPKTVTGKFTKYKGSDATREYTIGGEVYQAAVKGEGLNTLGSDNNINKTYTLTLDQYGYILSVGDEDVAEDVYAFVLDYSADKNRGEYDYALKLLFTDGTTKWVDVSEVDDKVVADGDVSETELGNLNKKFVSFTEKDGKYDVTTEAATAVNGDITKGTSTIFTDKVASSKTIFLVKKDGAYTVYTGIKNVPSMNVASGEGHALLDGSVAKIVVVNKSASTSNEDQVFIYDTTVVGTEKDGSTVIKYYNALVNGEDTTIGVSDASFNGSAAQGLYVNNSYTDKYISKMGTKFDAAASDTATVIVTNQATDGLSDVTLKNGIVTIDATSDKTYVTADTFNSYIVKGTSKAIEDLALDSDKTFGDSNSSEGYALASGDYVVVVLDDDNYITDLYLFDASL